MATDLMVGLVNRPGSLLRASEALEVLASTSRERAGTYVKVRASSTSWSKMPSERVARSSTRVSRSGRSVESW
jgi:hypothetical protein